VIKLEFGEAKSRKDCDDDVIGSANIGFG